MAEFMFLAYFVVFERFLVPGQNKADALELWTHARASIHPAEPGLALHCLKSSNPMILEQQLQPDAPEVFDFVSNCSSRILLATRLDVEKSDNCSSAVSSSALGSVFEYIQGALADRVFFYHKARAYEAFMLGLLSSYEYLALGTFEKANVRFRWRKETEKLPFSASRTLADVNVDQEIIVDRLQSYSEEEAEVSLGQVISGLVTIAGNLMVFRDPRCCRLLGFPSQL